MGIGLVGRAAGLVPGASPLAAAARAAESDRAAAGEQAEHVLRIIRFGGVHAVAAIAFEQQGQGAGAATGGQQDVHRHSRAVRAGRALPDLAGAAEPGIGGGIEAERGDSAAAGPEPARGGEPVLHAEGDAAAGAGGLDQHRIAAQGQPHLDGAGGAVAQEEEAADPVRLAENVEAVAAGTDRADDKVAGRHHDAGVGETLVAREIERADLAVRRLPCREDVERVAAEGGAVEPVLIAADDAPGRAAADQVGAAGDEDPAIGAGADAAAEDPVAGLHDLDEGEFLGREGGRGVNAAAQQRGAIAALTEPVQEDAHILHLVGVARGRDLCVGDRLVVEPLRVELAPDRLEPVRIFAARGDVVEADRADLAAAARGLHRSGAAVGRH